MVSFCKLLTVSSLWGNDMLQRTVSGQRVWAGERFCCIYVDKISNSF